MTILRSVSVMLHVLGGHRADVWSDESIGSVNDKRNFYHNQDAILLMKANDTDNLFGIFGHEFDEFLVSRERIPS